MGGYWTFVRLLAARGPVDTPGVGKGGRASRRRPPTHRPGRCRIKSAPPAAWVVQRPLKARTPARPDGANLNPPAPAAGGFSFGAKRPRYLVFMATGACGNPAIPIQDELLVRDVMVSRPKTLPAGASVGDLRRLF